MERYAPYRSYLLRLWPTSRAGLVDYRVLLESVATRERKVFTDLQSLFAFLQTQRTEDLEDCESPSDSLPHSSI